jgi:hypothetical protein
MDSVPSATSKPFSLNYKDIVKGLVVAVIAAALGILQHGLTAHGLDFQAYDWAGILNVVIGAAVAYLVKNFISDTNGHVLTPLGKVG